MENVFEFKISALEASVPIGTTPAYLKKTWSISDRESKLVIEANTQLNCQSSDGLGLLSCHFSTNNQMLR